MFLGWHRWIDERPRPKAPAPPPRRRLRDWPATAVMILGIAALLVPFLAVSAANPHKKTPVDTTVKSSTSGPTLTMSPVSGMVGQRVVVDGSGLPASTKLTLTWDAKPLDRTTVTTSRDGTFRMRLRIPRVALGKHVIGAVPAASTARTAATSSPQPTATGANADGSIDPLASTSFTVVAKAAPAAPDPTPTRPRRRRRSGRRPRPRRRPRRRSPPRPPRPRSAHRSQRRRRPRS